MTNELSVSDQDDYDLFVPMPRAKQRVIDAVKELGLKVLPADVVAKTALPLHEATSLLNKVAAETKATLQVASSGDILYVFPPRFEQVYSLRGAQKTLRTLALTLFRLGFFILRLSFGTILIVSLLVVVTLIITCILAAIAAALGDSGGGDFGGDVGDGFNFFDLGSIGDGFNWNYTDSHQRRIEHYGVAEKTWRPAKQVQKGNFFLECFSFLFGDGDPNQDLDDFRWRCILDVISKNNYVIVAEQIAPFTGTSANDDSAMFAVMAKFDGVPVVTDQGSILYVFDRLRQRSANLPSSRANVPRYLEERHWSFSEYPAPALFTVLIFASLNFLGSWWLFKHIATIALLQHFVLIIDVLLGYGALFLLIPLSRLVFCGVMNQLIEQRNRKRETLAQELTTPQARQKLQEADTYARAMSSPVIGEIVYRTDRDILEQQFER